MNSLRADTAVTWTRLMLLAAASLCGISSVSAQDLSVEKDFMLIGEEAVGLMPPELAAEPTVTRMVWSSDGRFLLVERMDMRLTKKMLEALVEQEEPELQVAPVVALEVWDSGNGQRRQVWKGDSGSALERLGWLHGTDVVYAVVRRVVPARPGEQEESGIVYGLMHIDASSGRTKLIAEIPDPGPGLLEYSPGAPVAILGGPLEPGRRLFFHIQGSQSVLGPAVMLPEGVSWFDVSWSADGKLPYITTLTLGSAGEKPVRRVFAVDTAKAELAELAEAPSIPPRTEPETPLKVSSDDAPLAGGYAKTGFKARVLLLHPAQPPKDAGAPAWALVTSDGSDAEMSPTGDAVAYISQGAAFVRRLARIPKQKFLEARQAAERAEVLSRGKQAGLAVLMYASDWDDTLPSSGQDVRDLLKPYTRNEDVLKDFVYTLEGGSLSDVQSPSETMMGYIPTPPSGYAVVYVDGHVQWSKSLPEK